MDDTARITYRYLRVSIVVMTCLLGVSIALATADGARFGSISAAYYSPVRAIFVGTLVAVGPALVAIKGRDDGEDLLLNLAGMLSPVVALVPAPAELGPGVCGAGVERCVAPDLVPGVENSVASLLLLGVALLAFAWVSSARRGMLAVGLVVATAAFAGFALWFLVGRASFLQGAHWAAAVTFFLLVAGVAYLSARHAAARTQVRMLQPGQFAAAYRVIAVLMAAVVALGAALIALGATGVLTPPSGTTFVVEAVLLAAFLVFWVLQTAENWDVEAGGVRPWVDGGRGP